MVVQPRFLVGPFLDYLKPYLPHKARDFAKEYGKLPDSNMRYLGAGFVLFGFIMIALANRITTVTKAYQLAEPTDRNKAA